MALTNWRWAAIVGVACALLVALKLPPKGQPRPDWTSFRSHQPEADVAAGLRRRILELNARISVLARRDTLLAATRDSSRPLIVATTTLTPEERSIYERRARTQAAAIGEGARRLVLGIVADTSRMISRALNYTTERQFLLPEATDGEHCLTIVRLGRGRRLLGPPSAEGMYGPCAFYAAFGAPGNSVDAWLRERGYDVAFDAIIPPVSETNPDLLDSRRLTREEEFKRYVDFNHGYKPRYIAACSAGDRDACATALRTSGREERTQPIPNVALTERVLWYEERLGNSTGSLLSDLLAEQGRERFEKFWKSSADLETAFSSAFGESTGEWTMRWMHYRYGRDTRGPYIDPKAALLSLITVLGLVTASAALARFREAV